MAERSDIPPGIYTIPAGLSFATMLARGLMDMAGGDPMALADMTLLLPTRRACRTMREAFLALSQGRPLLLPRMRPLSDGDPDEMAMTMACDSTGDSDMAREILEIPPAISLLRRRLVLARLIRELPSMQNASADQAVGLAAELAKLLDEIQTEGLSFDHFHDLVPEEYARHWQITIKFLDILSENWPAMLEEEGVIDPAERRNRVLDAQARTWRQHPPQHKVIAAGSTGTIPAAAELLKVIAGLPQGYVVLPGLDRELDDSGWDEVAPTHPQFGLKLLLQRLGKKRSDVADWPVSPFYNQAEPGDVLEERRQARVALLSHVMCPAEMSDRWRDLGGEIDRLALSGLQRIDCATPQEEADVIALIMRQTLEDPGQTAALVTPDRFLARRVAMSLRRWDIVVDDSGGQSLPLTRAGGWLRLTARMLLDNLAPVDLLACLKHPLAACGMNPAEFNQLVARLEVSVLRGLRPAPGVEGLRAVISNIKQDDQRNALRAFVDRIEAAIAPLRDAFASDGCDVGTMLEHHLRVVEAMAATDTMDGGQRIWAHEDGEAAAAFAAELAQASDGLPPVNAAEYCGLVDGLMRGVMVRPRYGFHPRLAILGMLEARMYQADVMILGGLNEGTWPPDPGADPWMSRPMREKLCLPSPDFAVGMAAHDFVQCAAAPNVVITRSERSEGAPSVPSRWLDRLDTVLRGAGLKDDEAGINPLYDSPWLSWARMLDTPDRIRPAPAPTPRPPVERRPRRLSVTRIGQWMRDPYTIYARHILNLKKLDDIDADPGAAERGNLMHNALARFVAEYPKDLPKNALEILADYGREAFGALLDQPEIHSFWWPRFMRMARSFLEFEAEWRQKACPVAQEVDGEISLMVKTGPEFTLYGRADRIDKTHDGQIAIIDYKTGVVPKAADITLGLDPQLPLEALMASHGGFKGVDAAPVGYIAHWQVSGGATPFAEVLVKQGRQVVDPQTLAAEAHDGLIALIEHFDDPQTPYRPVPRRDHAPKYNDYAHLARIAEWATVEAEAGES